MLKLQRNLDTQRNKEQEDSFENSMNLDLFFDSNKVIEKIESWSMANIKKLCKNWDCKKDIIFEYSKWTNNVQYLFDNLQTSNTFVPYEFSDEEQNIFREKNIFKIHEWIKDNKEKDKQFGLLLFLALETKNNKKIIEIINNVVNNGLTNLEFAIDFVLPIFLARGNYE